MATYTYQGGKKLVLSRATTYFVARGTKEQLLANHFQPLHEVSAHSWSVETTVDRLQEDLERARQVLPAYPAYTIAASGTGFLVTDRIFLRFRHQTADNDAHQFGERFKLAIIERLSPRDFLCKVPQGSDVIDVVRNLTEQELAEVELVDHDLNIRPHVQELIANEPDSAEQWHLYSKIYGHPLIHNRALLDCEGAWKACGYGDYDVVIAVVDSGCDLSDPNFAPGKFENWAVLLDGELLERNSFTSPVSASIMDPPRLHGTLCATLAAASVNQFGGVGVAPNCKLVPVKWQDLCGTTSFPQSLFSKIVRFLRNKADVVSNSWNRGANAYWPPYICEILQEAALYGGRHGNGMVWVWSAGNRNCPIQHSGTVEVPIKVESMSDALSVTKSSSEFRNSFVGIEGVVHVGAISSVGQRCHYSNYGTGLEFVAPSGNYHLYGRDSVKGVDVNAPLGQYGLRAFRGTSAAAPLVAGVAALVRSANPRLTSSGIISVMRRTADRDLDMTAYQPCSRLPDPNPSWDISPIAPFHSGQFTSGHPDGPWSPWFGFGKVNARKAVEAAMQM
jgi:hypothetical protein